MVFYLCLIGERSGDLTGQGNTKEHVGLQQVAEKMVEWSKCAISNCQAGFRRHRSTMDQVVKLTQAIKDPSTESNPPLLCWWISKLHTTRCVKACLRGGGAVLSCLLIIKIDDIEAAI
ncbi:hypothetical protein TNCV_4997181 [Trichonephila clavipes]|nr:hypothetical protein TNCV_4997181 [Trichonephila clavipes]